MPKDKKMRSTTRTIVPETYVLEVVLETLSRELGLIIEDRPTVGIIDMGAIRVAQGHDFELDYRRFSMGGGVEEEGLKFEKDHVNAYFATEDGNLDLTYAIDKSIIVPYRAVLRELGKKADIAKRLSLGTWNLDHRDTKRVYKRMKVSTPDEIVSFLTAYLSHCE